MSLTTAPSDLHADRRTTEVKQRLFAAIATSPARVGVADEDVFIGYVESTPADWSFGSAAPSTSKVISAPPL
ncbi:tautomerase family protein [Streptomyces sp. NPDC050759]|uniref:tautomerase family protein n=1 Tax=Streptomyces sp. NPDC050759 TaxID=3365635 RepID=UPI00378DA309